MATNPMQRKSRNSFFMGVLITLIFCAIIIIILFLQMNRSKLKNGKEDSVKNVYVLAQDVNAGQVLTQDMFVVKQVNESMVPVDATSDIAERLRTYSLCTKDGKHIVTSYEKKENGEYDTEKPIYYYADEKDEKDKKKIYKEEKTNRLYVLEGEEKSYIETVQAPIVAKIQMKANTVITNSLISLSDELQTDDLRQQEYNILSLPTDLITGDYVDVRFMLPSGQDFIVVSKKKVSIPMTDGIYLSDTVQINLTEDEILSMSSAIVEAVQLNGSKLYATKYTDPGIQIAAVATYPVNREVVQQISVNPNILADAKSALAARYSMAMRNDYINNELSQHGDRDKLPEEINKSIENTKETRKQYLNSLVLSVPAK